jgi:hypothetical protein
MTTTGEYSYQIELPAHLEALRRRAERSVHYREAVIHTLPFVRVVSEFAQLAILLELEEISKRLALIAERVE